MKYPHALKQPLILLGTLICLLCVGLIQAGQISGYVYTRAPVLKEGNRIWAEYAPTSGKFVKEIAVATGDAWSADKWRVMSGSEYEGYYEQHQTLKVQHPTLAAPISRAAYDAATYYLADGITVMTKPPLKSTATAYVALLPQSARLLNDPDSLVLAEYPVDLSGGAANGAFTSMLLRYDGANIGEIKQQTSNRIAFRTAFIKDEQGNALDVPENWFEAGMTRKPGQSVVGPISNVVVEGLSNSRNVSGSDGQYTTGWNSIPCFYSSYSIDAYATATLRYQRFNPRSLNGQGVYYVVKPMVESCVPNFFMVPFRGPYPLGFGEVTTTPASMDFPIDVMVLSGLARINNVPVAEVTQFNAAAPDHSERLQQVYDFDNDGVFDTVKSRVQPVPGTTTNETETVQAVYLSSTGTDPNDSNVTPDLTRVMDSASFANHNDEGLLSQISLDDLRNTDLYVVRVSDGKLIAERIGLRESDVNPTDIGADAENSQFFYTLQIRNSFGDLFGFGYGGFKSNSSDFDKWQSDSGINPELHKQQADHLQPGDQIRLYAINRTSGYMGVADTTMKAASENSTGSLSVNIDTIEMQPPNLKISAVRGFNVKAGLEARTLREDQIIGFEGAALTSDNYIAITSEWYDPLGRPLPETLSGAGYTGRIAFLSGPQTLPQEHSGSGISTFEINPGKRLQVLQLPNHVPTDAQHYYIHVSGEPKSGNPIFIDTNNLRIAPVDFSSSGQNPGILEKRPDNYVPFKVQIFDEAATEIQRQVYRQLSQASPNITLEKPRPRYNWVYRPEFQFSNYQLEMRGIVAQVNDDQGQPLELIDLLAQNSTTLGGADLINLVYDLSTTDLLPLDYFNAGAEKELIFAVGAGEIRATLGEGNVLIFDDLSHINSLSSDDFNSIRLYANNDAGNVLWEYAFLNLKAAVDLNRDGVVDLTGEESSADKFTDKTTATAPFRFWLNDDYDVVKDSADIKLNITRCPPLADGEDQVCEQWDETVAGQSNISGANLSRIESERDLEDFAPLALTLGAPRNSAGYINLPDGLSVELTARGFGINLFKGKWTEGREYLDDLSVTQQQVPLISSSDNHLFELKPNQPRRLTQDDLNKVFGRQTTARLIFEGVQPSTLACVANASNCYLEIAVKQGITTVKSDKVYMNILPLEHYYDHYTVGAGELQEGATLLDVAVNINAAPYPYKDITVATDPEAQSFANEYIMMVHGWRMKYDERVSFGETAFKRLYWSGYKGRFGLFSWPTGWFNKPAHVYGKAQLLYVRNNQQNYGDSEALARMVGPKLSNVLATLNTGKTVHVFAHSMGNVVVSEALRNHGGKKLVENYVASQAAAAASGYNPSQPFIVHEDPAVGTTFSGPESAWRFYNLDNNLLDTEFDMPPNHYTFMIPPLHGATSPANEQQVAQQENWGPAYYADIGGKSNLDPTNEVGAGKIINFHNIEDAALTGWELNQLTKPDYVDGPTWEYNWNWDCPYSLTVCTLDVYPDVEDGEQVTDIYTRNSIQLQWNLQSSLDQNSADILGHIIPARTPALGQVAGTGTTTVINDSVNMNLGVFGYRNSNQDHSAQFHNNFAVRQGYWSRLLLEFGLASGQGGN